MVRRRRSYVVGAVLALALWSMFFFTILGRSGGGGVAPSTYFAASVLGVVFGYALFRLGDENAVWWAPGFILAGSVVSARSLASRDAKR